MSYSRFRIKVGEIFDPNVISSKSILVFPTPECLTQRQFSDSSNTPKQIVLIDASWKKAKKIFYLNPFLQRLPLLSLKSSQPSQYKVRKASNPNYISTIEACVEALKYYGEDTSDVLQAFHQMNQDQVRFQPH